MNALLLLQVGSLVRVTATDEDGCSPMIPADIALLACNEVALPTPKTRNLKSETRNPKLETRNPKLETQYPKHGTVNSKLENRGRELETRIPKP